nr:hypothetical protein [Tanacetum cinerariifolium]
TRNVHQSSIVQANGQLLSNGKPEKMFHKEEDGSQKITATQVKVGYEWAQREYIRAERGYEQSLKVKPDFYERRLTLGLQQFEQAKLSWYNNTRSKSNNEEGAFIQILELYNKADDNMEKEVAVEKFELAGASETDTTVIIKNHCSKGTTLEGLGFKLIKSFRHEMRF